jgi:hypothetical protein
VSGQGRLTPRKARLPRQMRPGWLKRMDQRTLVAKSLHDRMAGISDDLGGMAELSCIQHSILERFIHSEAIAQQIEERARNGQEFDLGQYLAVVDRVQRLGQTLGLRRVAKQLSPLEQYAATAGGEGNN